MIDATPGAPLPCAMSAILSILRVLGMIVCVVGVVHVVWAIATYEKPDYSRSEDKEDDGALPRRPRR